MVKMMKEVERFWVRIWRRMVNEYDLMILCRLEEGGQTALGPALLVSISLASRVPGSKVSECLSEIVHCINIWT